MKTLHKTDEVFRLIHSMSANEKRFFKLSQRQAGEKKYLKAFDLIAAQKDYSEQELKAAISNYGVIKNQLFAAIVKSLRNMPLTEQSPNVALKNEVVEIKILAHRGLQDRAKKRLYAAKRMALEYQRFPELLELLYLELQLFNKDLKTEEKVKQLDDCKAAIKNSLQSLDDLFAALLTNEEFNLHLRKMKVVRSEEERMPFQKFLKHPLVKNPENALTFEAKVIYTLMKSALFSLQGKREKSLIHEFNLIEEAEKNLKLIIEIPASYISVLHNGLMGAVMSNDEKRVHQIANLMRNLPVHSLHYKNRAIFTSYIFEHSFSKQRGEFKKAEALLLELESLITKRNIKLSLEHEQILLMYKGDFYFFKGDMQKASDSFGQIIFNKNYDTIRLENGAIARCLYLLAQFELNELAYMKGLLKSFKKFLIKAHYWHEPEKLVFDFLAKWNPAKSRSEKKQMLEHYLKKMEAAMKNSADSTLATYYFDFVPWFQSKLTGRSCAELMAERK